MGTGTGQGRSILWGSPELVTSSHPPDPSPGFLGGPGVPKTDGPKQSQASAVQ